jgi:hypothetical protein
MIRGGLLVRIGAGVVTGACNVGAVVTWVVGTRVVVGVTLGTPAVLGDDVALLEATVGGLVDGTVEGVPGALDPRVLAAGLWPACKLCAETVAL